MDEKPADKLSLKDRMLIFSALERTYTRETAFDIATKSDDYMLKVVAIASADQNAAQILMHDLATLREKREGTEADKARRWQRRVNRALDHARYDTPAADSAARPRSRSCRSESSGSVIVGKAI
jgi:hypothetical protein